MHKILSREFTLDRPPGAAIGLFTPRGEEAWVPGWAPVYIRPASGDTVPEMLFTTGAGEELTFWTCLAWEPDAGHARYLRLTPASRAAFVDVRCDDNGAGGTRVRVEYDVTALTAAGEALVAEMSAESFAGQIGAWPELIAAHAPVPA